MWALAPEESFAITRPLFMRWLLVKSFRERHTRTNMSGYWVVAATPDICSRKR